MDEDRKQALRAHHQGLRSGLILENVLPAFGIYLTDVEYMQVEGKEGNVAQVDALVRILLTKENWHFDGFTSICEHNGYPHWAKTLRTAAGVGCKEEEGSTSPAIHRLFQASVDAPKRSTPPHDENDCLQHDDDEPPPLKHRRVFLSTGEKQVAIALLGDGRQKQKSIPYPLAVIQVNIPVNLQKALKCIVIGHYAEVFRSVCSHLAKVISQHTSRVSGIFTGFSNGDGVAFEFGLGTVQHLPIQALNHPALLHSDDYKSILQLIMEAILMAPNPKENLDKFLRYPNLQVPESLQLLYRSRLPSVATDEELRDELASQCRHLADSLKDEQQRTNFAVSKNTLYLAQVYDATAYINRHQIRTDSTSIIMHEADFHKRAMEERRKYGPCTDLEKAILKLESTHSVQSQGYAYADISTKSLECTVVRREHAEKARALHEEAINEHATPLLEIIHMDKGMSEGAAFVVNLRFEEMLRNLRPAQLDYILYSSKWSEEEKKRKLKHHLALIVDEFDRICDQVSGHTAVVPVLEDLLAEMEENMIQLKEDVARGCIKRVLHSRTYCTGYAYMSPIASQCN